MINKLIKAIKYWLEKERKIIVASLLMGFVFTIASGVYTKSYAEKTSAAIAENMIRFHVLANSDSQEDQDLKIIVRDTVLEKYSETLDSSASIAETKKVLEDNLSQIQELAQNTVNENGYNYQVSVSLSKVNFPTREYGDITLPAGKYDALRIEIGESQGQNWWCVMFPPLCFVDVTKNEIHPETKEALMGILSEEEYALIDNNLRNEDMQVKIKFKIVEWWQEKLNADGTDRDEEVIIVKT